MTGERPGADGGYHPHHPSTDNDLHERLCDNARKMANPFRLMCGTYTAEEEAELFRLWQSKAGK
jgi:hypothetical protein